MEFSRLGHMEVFMRESDGSTSVRRKPFSPFLWRAPSDAPEDGKVGLVPKSFPTWRRYRNARDRLERGGTPFFAFNDPVQQYLTTSGRTLFKAMRFEEMRRMQIDIETTISEGFEFSNPERDPILAIAMSDSMGWEEILTVEEGSAESERDALEKLTATIQARDPDAIEGHNLFKFDLPFLETRAKRFGVRLAWGRDGSTLTSRPSRLQIAEKAIHYPKFRVRGRHIVDTLILAQYYDVASRELESFGLKSVARHFGVAEKDRIVLEGINIQRVYREDRDAFRTYALQDVRETRALSAILSRSYFFQAQIFPYNYQDVIVRGNATKVDALFLREYLRQGHLIPDIQDTRSFEGGYTDVFVREWSKTFGIATSLRSIPP